MALLKVLVAPLKVIILIHFALTVWANQCVWLPISYQFCNFLVLAVGVGAVVAESNVSMSQLFLYGMAFASIHDIIIIAMTYDGDKTGHACNEKGHFRFSFAMSIVNLVLKPISCLLIYLNHVTRSGNCCCCCVTLLEDDDDSD